MSKKKSVKKAIKKVTAKKSTVKKSTKKTSTAKKPVAKKSSAKKVTKIVRVDPKPEPRVVPVVDDGVVIMNPVVSMFR